MRTLYQTPLVAGERIAPIHRLFSSGAFRSGRTLRHLDSAEVQGMKEMATTKAALATEGPYKQQYLLGIKKQKMLDGERVQAYRDRPYLSEFDTEPCKGGEEYVQWSLRVLVEEGSASIQVVELSRKKLHKLGSLVRIESGSTVNSVIIYIEKKKHLGWAVFEKQAKSFSSQLAELDRVSDGLNIIALGFFPEMFLVGDYLSSREIIHGSIALRLAWEMLWESKTAMVTLNRTWEFDSFIPVGEALQLTRELVFVGDQSEFSGKVHRMLQNDKGAMAKRKHPSGSDSDTSSRPSKKQKDSSHEVPAQQPDIEFASTDEDDSPDESDMVKTPNLRGGLKEGFSTSLTLFPDDNSDDIPEINAQKPKKQGNYSEPKTAEKSLMETGLKKKLLMKPKPENDADLEKVAASAEFDHDEMISKFVLELSDFVNIPVELLENPGEDLRSRPFNHGRCEKLRDAMIQNSSQMPQFADVLPISRKVVEETGKVSLVQFKDLTKEEIYKRIPECLFVTISGQHSSSAMNWIREKAESSDCPHLKGVAEKFRFRQCRILVGNLPRSEYITLGLMANPEAGKKMYDTPFVQKVKHIRSLYHYNNCPPRPKPGIGKSSAFLIWETEAIKLLGNTKKTHTPFGNVQWAIFGGETVFKLWVELCHLFMKGLLPEKDGIVQPSKQEREVKSTYFKNLEGDIPESQILSILEDVKDYKILFAKTGKGGCNKDSINEAASRYKDSRWVQRLLICKLQAEFPGSTTNIKSWECVVSKCPAIEEHFSLLYSLLDRDDIKNKNKTPAPELVTETCASSLRKLWMAAVPSAVSNISEGHLPYHVLLLKEKENCTLTAPLPRIKYAACRLAIVDFTATSVQAWSTGAVSSLVKAVHSIFSTSWLQFIFLLSPADGVTMASVFDFIFKPPELNPYKIECDHGSFWPHRLQGTAGPKHLFAPVYILRAFISSKIEAWSSIIAGENTYYLSYNADVDKDIDPHFDMSTVQSRLEHKNAAHVLRGGHEKTPKEIWHDILALYPPHHTMCGLVTSTRSATLFPDRVAREIVLKNLNPKEIVIDCFSGRWVSKIALLNDRECAAYTISKAEFEFLETYLPLFKGIDAAKHIFKSASESGSKSASQVTSTSTSLSARVQLLPRTSLQLPATSMAITTRSTNTRNSKMTIIETDNEVGSAETAQKNLQLEVNNSNDSNSSMTSGLLVSNSKTDAANLNADSSHPTKPIDSAKPDDVTADSQYVSPTGGDLVIVSVQDAGSPKDFTNPIEIAHMTTPGLSAEEGLQLAANDPTHAATDPTHAAIDPTHAATTEKICLPKSNHASNVQQCSGPTSGSNIIRKDTNALNIVPSFPRNILGPLPSFHSIQAFTTPDTHCQPLHSGSSSLCTTLTYHNELKRISTIPSIQEFVDNLASHRPRKLLVVGLESLVLIQNMPFPPSQNAIDFVLEDLSLPSKKTYVRYSSGLPDFISKLSNQYDFSIWSSTTSVRTSMSICEYLFHGELLFVWTRAEGRLAPGTSRSHRSLLKPLSTIQMNYPEFNSTNTVFLDEDPIFFISNPFHTYLCLPTNMATSTFLIDVLLPYLLLLGDAWDIRLFIKNHHPRWSMSSILKGQNTQPYKMLVRMMCLPSKVENFIPKYHFALLSPFEISFHDQKMIMEFGDSSLESYGIVYIEHATCLHFRPDIIPKNLLQKENLRPGEKLVDYAKRYYMEFLFARQQLLPSSFQPSPTTLLCPCNRDIKADPDGDYGTCSISPCRSCGVKNLYRLHEKLF